MGHVYYLQSVNSANKMTVAFLFASCRIAPHAATTIPRFELCADLDVAQTTKHVNLDNQVVLDCLNNSVKRF